MFFLCAPLCILNLLLNVGPTARGCIPKASLDILAEVGQWMDANAASIRGCGKAELDKPDWGRYTQNGKTLYAHVTEESVGPLNLRGLGGKVKSVRLLSDMSEVLPAPVWNVREFKGDAFYSLSSSGSCLLPDERDTVLEITLV